MNFVPFCAGGTPTAKPSASVGACAFGAVLPLKAIEKSKVDPCHARKLHDDTKVLSSPLKVVLRWMNLPYY